MVTRIAAEVRFIVNTIKEAIIHPLSTSVIDKRTGKVLSKKNDKVTLKVSMEVTEGQALALKAMFEYWNYLSSIGASRNVAFMVDGDGDFHPSCKVETDPPIRELDDELRKLAVVRDERGDRLYDFDSVSYRISDDYKFFEVLE